MTERQRLANFLDISKILSLVCYTYKFLVFEASEARSFSRMVSLYAIIKQEYTQINFNADPWNVTTENIFGHVDITIQTETQFPFALRSTSDNVAPPVIETETPEFPSIRSIE